MPILMMTSKFVYSPNGVGEQCYREYEALISGAIPVLDETNFTYSTFNLLHVFFRIRYFHKKT